MRGWIEKGRSGAGFGQGRRTFLPRCICAEIWGSGPQGSALLEFELRGDQSLRVGLILQCYFLGTHWFALFRTYVSRYVSGHYMHTYSFMEMPGMLAFEASICFPLS
jgi:hypothetical protein